MREAGNLLSFTQRAVQPEWKWKGKPPFLLDAPARIGDEANLGHVVRHSVLPEEAEQVILNDPVDIGMEIVEGESAISTLARQCKAGFFSW